MCDVYIYIYISFKLMNDSLPISHAHITHSLSQLHAVFYKQLSRIQFDVFVAIQSAECVFNFLLSVCDMIQLINDLICWCQHRYMWSYWSTSFALIIIFQISFTHYHPLFHLPVLQFLLFSVIQKLLFFSFSSLSVS